MNFEWENYQESDRICRCCLEKNVNLKKVSKHIAHLIKKLCDIEINEVSINNDPLDLMCYECTSALKQCHSLRVQIINNDLKLKRDLEEKQIQKELSMNKFSIMDLKNDLNITDLKSELEILLDQTLMKAKKLETEISSQGNSDELGNIDTAINENTDVNLNIAIKEEINEDSKNFDMDLNAAINNNINEDLENIGLSSNFPIEEEIKIEDHAIDSMNIDITKLETELNIDTENILGTQFRINTEHNYSIYSLWTKNANSFGRQCLAGEQSNQTVIYNVDDDSNDGDNSQLDSQFGNGNESSVQCKECGKVFNYFCRLKTHMLTHAKRKFTCTICSKELTSQRSLKSHLLIHEKIKPLKCELCEKSFVHVNSLKIHMNVHKGVRFECDHCDSSFSTKHRYTDHMRKEHTKEKPFACTRCDEKFHTSEQLRYHKRIHEEGTVKIFKCSVCQAGFKRRSERVAHQLTHTFGKPFACDVCSMSFKTKCVLVRHYRVHETDKFKRHQCNICSKDFLLKQQLKMHLRTHTGEKPYECKVCEKKFKFPSNLWEHEKIHKNVRNFACTQCNKAFRTRAKLRDHIRTHTGERPYSCDFCEKSFSAKSTKDIHMKKHTEKGENHNGNSD